MSTSVSEEYTASIFSVEMSWILKVAGYIEVVGELNGSQRTGVASQNQQETYALTGANYFKKSE
jgi:hypothetical protein